MYIDRLEHKLTFLGLRETWLMLGAPSDVEEHEGPCVICKGWFEKYHTRYYRFGSKDIICFPCMLDEKAKKPISGLWYAWN